MIVFREAAADSGEKRPNYRSVWSVRIEIKYMNSSGVALELC